MSCLYILEINPLSLASFANIFFHFKGCLFVLFMVSFALQKLLNLIRSHLFCFFHFQYSRMWIQKDIVGFYVKECLSMLSSKGFIVCSLTFRSLTSSYIPSLAYYNVDHGKKITWDV